LWATLRLCAAGGSADGPVWALLDCAGSPCVPSPNAARSIAPPTSLPDHDHHQCGRTAFWALVLQHGSSASSTPCWAHPRLKIPWIADKTWAMKSIVLMTLLVDGRRGQWWILLAGPGRIFPRAVSGGRRLIDGANTLESIPSYHPCLFLRPVLFFVLVMNVIGAFQVFRPDVYDHARGPSSPTAAYWCSISMRRRSTTIRMGYRGGDELAVSFWFIVLFAGLQSRLMAGAIRCSVENPIHEGHEGTRRKSTGSDGMSCGNRSPAIRTKRSSAGKSGRGLLEIAVGLGAFSHPASAAVSAGDGVQTGLGDTGAISGMLSSLLPTLATSARSWAARKRFR